MKRTPIKEKETPVTTGQLTEAAKDYKDKVATLNKAIPLFLQKTAGSNEQLVKFQEENNGELSSGFNLYVDWVVRDREKFIYLLNNLETFNTGINHTFNTVTNAVAENNVYKPKTNDQLLKKPSVQLIKQSYENTPTTPERPDTPFTSPKLNRTPTSVNLFAGKIEQNVKKNQEAENQKAENKKLNHSTTKKILPTQPVVVKKTVTLEEVKAALGEYKKNLSTLGKICELFLNGTEPSQAIFVKFDQQNKGKLSGEVADALNVVKEEAGQFPAVLENITYYQKEICEAIDKVAKEIENNNVYARKTFQANYGGMKSPSVKEAVVKIQSSTPQTPDMLLSPIQAKHSQYTPTKLVDRKPSQVEQTIVKLQEKENTKSEQPVSRRLFSSPTSAPVKVQDYVKKVEEERRPQRQHFNTLNSTADSLLVDLKTLEQDHQPSGNDGPKTNSVRAKAQMFAQMGKTKGGLINRPNLEPKAGSQLQQPGQNEAQLNDAKSRYLQRKESQGMGWNKG